MINGKPVAQVFVGNCKKAPNSNFTNAEQAFPLKHSQTLSLEAKQPIVLKSPAPLRNCP